MKVFVSYNRSDQQAVGRLVAQLTARGHVVWSDARLRGGQAWWDEILDQIERADAVVLALSPEYLSSNACAVERGYATRLGKTLMPVKVVPFHNSALPGDFSLQISTSVPALLEDLRSVPAWTGTVDPRGRPAAPVSQYTLLRDRICDSRLPIEEQFAIVAELYLYSRSGAEDERESGRQLLLDSSRSRHLYAAPARLFTELHVRPEPVRTSPWLTTVGAALGGVGFFSLLIYLGVYKIVNKPFDVVVPHVTLALVGMVLCAVELPHHRRSAAIGLAVCGVSIAAAALDLLNVYDVI